ncbi:hypothetical protein HNP46_003726 [Pseudomonas nitritireducens]|uniref:Uncharacterized protein n=1 Tax=Pseudomonas nitroreducens TaxID=46680 RepID=A0A7W7KL93_PSENT|nr:hypothetical protein [Pseudomonas nitritireducens]MBB4864854.1 hypothetical protein [Pseudomonas nitritireducens]
MPQLPRDEVPARRRMRWHWRLLTLKIYILCTFLLACLLGGSAMLFLNTLNETLEPAQRVGSLLAGGVILLVCLHILRMALPPLPGLSRRRGLE